MHARPCKGKNDDERSRRKERKRETTSKCKEKWTSRKREENIGPVTNFHG